MFCQSCGTNNADGAKFCSKCGGTLSANANYANAPQNQAGYTQGPVNNTGYTQAPPKKKKKGCMVTAIIVVAIAAILIVIAVLNGGSFSLTTANINNTVVSGGVDATGKPLNATNTFATNSPVVYVTVTVKNAPESTKVRALWIYTDSDIEITSYEILTEDSTQTINFSLTKPTNGFPQGKYEVQFFIDDTYKKSAYFTVQ